MNREKLSVALNLIALELGITAVSLGVSYAIAWWMGAV